MLAKGFVVLQVAQFRYSFFVPGDGRLCWWEDGRGFAGEGRMVEEKDGSQNGRPVEKGGMGWKVKECPGEGVKIY